MHWSIIYVCLLKLNVNYPVLEESMQGVLFLWQGKENRIGFLEQKPLLFRYFWCQPFIFSQAFITVQSKQWERIVKEIQLFTFFFFLVKIQFVCSRVPINHTKNPLDKSIDQNNQHLNWASKNNGLGQSFQGPSEIRLYPD